MKYDYFDHDTWDWYEPSLFERIKGKVLEIAEILFICLLFGALGGTAAIVGVAFVAVLCNFFASVVVWVPVRMAITFAVGFIITVIGVIKVIRG